MARPTASREVLSLTQIAEETKLAVKTLRNLRSKGELPFTWLMRNRVVCYRDDLDAWIASQAGQSNVTRLKRRA